MEAEIIKKTKEELIIAWNCEKGFGELSMVWDKDKQVYILDSELMDVFTIVEIFKSLNFTKKEESDEFIFFFGGIFSQWYKTKFVIDGVEYCTAEQYMMQKKALMFNDYEAASKIMKTTSQKEQKSIGRTVKNFDVNKWVVHCREIVYDANMAKFTQNEELLNELMDSGNKEFCEASPYDRIWGVGLSEDNLLIKSKENWKGMNWLGEAITQVRDDLRKTLEETK